jgi:N-acetylmuramic acid 6-phosphate etherase
MKAARRGYAELPTEAVGRASRDLDRMSARQIVGLMAREDQAVPAAVARAGAAIARLAEAVAAALAAGGRLIYVGAGTSGRLGVLDAAECPPTFGVAPGRVVGVIAGGRAALTRAVEGAEDDAVAGGRALARLRVAARDVVCGIAASGVTPFTLGALDAARRVGATTALVTAAPAPAHRRLAEIVVGLAVGPEVLAGSSRLKAGTATKLALNAITTTAMVLGGKCYGNRMVDLRATNAKLTARALRILADETGLGPAAARRLLCRAGGRVKTALAMQRAGLGRADAERALAAADGRLRALIGPPRGRA